jgi:ketosteroid isomerase-like protein
MVFAPSVQRSIMENIKDSLLSLKEKALEATKNADAGFYQDYLADNAVAVVPIGVLNKEAILKQMEAENSSFKSSKIEDVRVIELTPESGIVTYTATFDSRPEDIPSASEVYVTTVYAKINGKWKGVFYQQTPVKHKEII